MRPLRFSSRSSRPERPDDAPLLPPCASQRAEKRRAAHNPLPSSKPWTHPAEPARRDPGGHLCIYPCRRPSCLQSVSSSSCLFRTTFSLQHQAEPLIRSHSFIVFSHSPAPCRYNPANMPAPEPQLWHGAYFLILTYRTHHHQHRVLSRGRASFRSPSLSHLFYHHVYTSYHLQIRCLCTRSCIMLAPGPGALERVHTNLPTHTSTSPACYHRRERAPAPMREGGSACVAVARGTNRALMAPLAYL